MKYIKIAIAITFLLPLLLSSCANTSTPPMGGPKDTLAPVLIKVMPDSNIINFPVNDGRIELKFNEYVALKDAAKYITISPPLKRPVEAKIRSKSVIITFPTDLDSAKTYTISFGNAIVDNNEGNLFPPYSFALSTGGEIDSLFTNGSVVDYSNLLPVEFATVALYDNLSDTALYKTYPAKIAKTDKWGYFTIRNLKAVPYMVYAFMDVNNNNKFDPENEKIAFIDSLFTPSKIMDRKSPELAYVNIKDTTASLARSKEIQMYMFREPTVKQFLKENKRVERLKGYLTFASPNVKIDSMWFESVPQERIIKQFNTNKDSLVFWINDTSYVAPDTLYLNLRYFRTDSTDNLSIYDEKIEMIAPIQKKKKDDKPSRRANFGVKEDTKREDLLEFKIDSEAYKVEKYGFVLDFPAPLVSINYDSLSVTSISTKGQKSPVDFSILSDTSDVCVKYLKLKEDLKKGFDYILSVRKGAFTDIYKRYNDSLGAKAVLPNEEKLGKISLNIVGCEGRYIFELTNLTRDRVFRSENAKRDTTIVFPYLSPGKYSIRVTQDRNGNGKLDGGSVKERIQPEKVRLYKLGNGSTIISLDESIELTQTINLKELFR